MPDPSDRPLPITYSSMPPATTLMPWVLRFLGLWLALSLLALYAFVLSWIYQPPMNLLDLLRIIYQYELMPTVIVVAGFAVLSLNRTVMAAAIGLTLLACLRMIYLSLPSSRNLLQSLDQISFHAYILGVALTLIPAMRRADASNSLHPPRPTPTSLPSLASKPIEDLNFLIRCLGVLALIAPVFSLAITAVENVTATFPRSLLDEQLPFVIARCAQVAIACFLICGHRWALLLWGIQVPIEVTYVILKLQPLSAYSRSDVLRTAKGFLIYGPETIPTLIASLFCLVLYLKHRSVTARA